MGMALLSFHFFFLSYIGQVFSQYEVPFCVLCVFSLEDNHFLSFDNLLKEGYRSHFVHFLYIYTKLGESTSGVVTIPLGTFTELATMEYELLMVWTSDLICKVFYHIMGLLDKYTPIWKNLYSIEITMPNYIGLHYSIFIKLQYNELSILEN